MEKKETTLCQGCAEMAARTEECVRTHPKEAAIMSMLAGFLLAQFPLRLLAGALMQLAVLILKPAAIFYGIFRLVEDSYCRNHQEDWTPGQPESEK